jgi:putative membrane protein
MKRFVSLSGLSLLALGFYLVPAAYSQNQTPSPGAQKQPSATQAGQNQKALPPEDFVRRVSADNLAEINLGRMAEKQASNEDLKKFAQRLVKDHTKANDELNQLASRKNFRPAPAMDAKHQRLANQLLTLNGANFDRAFTKDMVKDHEAAVAVFEAEAKSGTDPDVKAYAAKVLPTLKEHLKIAQDLNKKILGPGGTGR